MRADESAPFTAKTEAGKEALYFCDIGDLLIYLKEKKAGRSLARVKDYLSGEWIEAAKAYYVTAPQRFTTPMGWSIAAFRDRKDAEGYGAPVDFESVLKGLK
jgi:nitrous oxide reductase accessory protein NosL